MWNHITYIKLNKSMTRVFSNVPRDRLDPPLNSYSNARPCWQSRHYASFWSSLSPLSMAHISLHNCRGTEGGCVARVPLVFRAGTRRKKGMEGPFSDVPGRTALCHHRRSVLVLPLLYHNIISWLPSRIVCSAERGVMCSHVHRGFCPLIKRSPRCCARAMSSALLACSPPSSTFT